MCGAWMEYYISWNTVKERCFSWLSLALCTWDECVRVGQKHLSLTLKVQIIPLCPGFFFLGLLWKSERKPGVIPSLPESSCRMVLFWDNDDLKNLRENKGCREKVWKEERVPPNAVGVKVEEPAKPRYSPFLNAGLNTLKAHLYLFFIFAHLLPFLRSHFWGWSGCLFHTSLLS